LQHPSGLRIVWIGLWPKQNSYVNARCYELLRRLPQIKQIRLPAVRGAMKLASTVARFFPYKDYKLFCMDLPVLRRWRQQAIVDIDDPQFSCTEIALLNDPKVQLVITTTQRLGRRFVTAGVAKPIEVIPSGYSRQDIKAGLAEEIARVNNADGHPIVGYSGATIAIQPNKPNQGNIALLVEAMEKVWSEIPEVQLWLLGEASKEVKYWAHGRKQVRLFGLIPRSRLLAYLQNFTVGTYPRLLDHGGRFSVKLIEYMAVGVPIVATDVSETHIIHQAKVGVSAATAADFSKALLGVIRNRSLRETMARNGVQFAESYDWDRISGIYQACLKNLIKTV
jgi:glycosyltransferase involved in cell wall biosynthesis